MRLRRTAALVAALTLTLSGAAACGSDSGSAGDAAGVLNIGMPNGPQTENHNPFLPSSSGASLGYRFVIYEPLVMTNQVKPTEEGKPWLATKWEWSDNFQKLVLTIRDDVKWSDGKPMTAEDVAYTFDLLKKTPALNINAIPFGDITAERQPGDHDVHRAAVRQPGRHPHAPSWCPSTIGRRSRTRRTDTVKNPIGTGPVRAEDVHAADRDADPARRVLAGPARRSRSCATPRTTTTTRRPPRSPTARRSGRSRSSRTTRRSTSTRTPRTTSCGSRRRSPSTACSSTPQHKPFDDPALRRAMNMVVDREDIFNQGEAGYFYPQVTSPTGIPTPAGDPFIADEYKTQKHEVDVDGAKQELTEAGYKLDGDTLLDKSGKPVKLTLSNPAGWSDYITDLEIIKDNLSDIGIAGHSGQGEHRRLDHERRHRRLRGGHALDQRRRDPVRPLPGHDGRRAVQADRRGGRQRQLGPLQERQGHRRARPRTPTPPTTPPATRRWTSCSRSSSTRCR